MESSIEQYARVEIAGKQMRGVEGKVSRDGRRRIADFNFIDSVVISKRIFDG